MLLRALTSFLRDYGDINGGQLHFHLPPSSLGIPLPLDIFRFLWAQEYEPTSLRDSFLGLWQITVVRICRIQSPSLRYLYILFARTPLYLHAILVSLVLLFFRPLQQFSYPIGTPLF